MLDNIDGYVDLESIIHDMYRFGLSQSWYECPVEEASAWVRERFGLGEGLRVLDVEDAYLRAMELSNAG